MARFAILLFAALVMTGIGHAAAVPPPLVAAVAQLDTSANDSLTVAHAFFDHAADTQAAWVLVRDVATFRSQARTLVNLVAGANPHLDVARNFVKNLEAIAGRVDKLLADPATVPAADSQALVASWTKTKADLAKVAALLPAPPTHP